MVLDDGWMIDRRPVIRVVANITLNLI